MKSRFLVILFFFGLFCSCDNKQFKYLALGDSYTIGESVDENLRWPVQLVKRFHHTIASDLFRNVSRQVLLAD